MNLLFSFVAIYTATCFPFLCILLQRGRINFIRQNLETPFHIHEDNRRTWYCSSSLLLADHSEGKMSSYRPVVFNFWTLPRRSGTTSVTTATGSPSNVATVPPDAALPFFMNCDLERFVSATTDFPSNNVKRKDFIIIFKPGRELGLGECPPVRAFTLPT